MQQHTISNTSSTTQQYTSSATHHQQHIINNTTQHQHFTSSTTQQYTSSATHHQQHIINNTSPSPIDNNIIMETTRLFHLYWVGYEEMRISLLLENWRYFPQCLDICTYQHPQDRTYLMKHKSMSGFNYYTANTHWQ